MATTELFRVSEKDKLCTPGCNDAFEGNVYECEICRTQYAEGIVPSINCKCENCGNIVTAINEVAC